MALVCVYCNGEDSSKEHVWPRWIRKHASEVMGISAPNTQQYAGAQESHGVIPNRSTERLGNSRLSMTINRVCEDCNTGWLSDLEEGVKPILRPMIEGKARPLTPTDQAVLITWATKTALNFAYWSEQKFTKPITSALAHQAYAQRDQRVPIPDVLIWLAAYEPLGQFAYRFMAAQGYGKHPTTGESHQIIRVVFVAGHAAFYVRLPDADVSQHLGWRDPLPQFTLVHPNQGAGWPNGVGA